MMLDVFKFLILIEFFGHGGGGKWYVGVSIYLQTNDRVF